MYVDDRAHCLLLEIYCCAHGFSLNVPSDVHEIVEYGNAVGLKMIIEMQPEELCKDIPHVFRSFGPCISYQPKEQNVLKHGMENSSEWINSCLAGKSFASVDEDGKVRVCGNTREQCGELRKSGCDFKRYGQSQTY